MDTLPAAEAKASFDQLLDRAARGETIVITRDGRPVAEMRPAVVAAPDPAAEPDARARRKRAIENWIAYRDAKRLTAAGLSWRAARDEGRH
jgi:antitoxin (DNA-binding transcriptional repressor) of toxin-antitoxin stability system